MGNVTLFSDSKAKLPSMPSGYEDNLTKTIAGGGSGGRRISIKGKAFRQVINGEEVHISEDNMLDVVIINAAPVSRQYYESAYQMDSKGTAPTCWSSDTQTPDASVPEDQRKASRCADCPMNIKGSGQGDTRACRFSQRVAVVLDGEIDREEVYQLQVPATSVFGDSKDGKMPLQAYGRFLANNDAHVAQVVTRMKFDAKSEQPKLFFNAVRPLSQDEFDICRELADSEQTRMAITMHSGPIDAGKYPPDEHDDSGEEEEAAEKPAKTTRSKSTTSKKTAEKAAKSAKPDVAEEEEEEDIPEPTVNKKKRAAPPPDEDDDDDLSSVLDEWDD